jgi:hypothetical protein
VEAGSNRGRKSNIQRKEQKIWVMEQNSEQGEIDIPSGPFGYFDTHQHFSPFTQLRTLGHEPQSSKVHVTPRNDRDVSFASILEIIVDNVGFESC